MAGTAVSSNLGFIAWEAEDSFADAADDTYTTRFVVRDDQIDISGLAHDTVNPGGVFQRLNERDAERLAAYGVKEFSFSVELQGHGSATNTSLTETNLALLLAHAVGNSDWTQVGGNITTGSADAEELTSTETTLLQGGLCRVGVLGDTRAEGQATVLSDATSTYELDVALPGTPTTADDIFAMGMIYPVSASGQGDILTSDASSSSNTLRFVVASGNLAFACRGCACTGWSLNNAGPGGMPTLTFTIATVYAEPISTTFPSATSTDDKVSAGPNANGSLFIADKGTVTRTTDLPLDVSFSVGQGMVPIAGPGGANSRQNIVGWRRVPAETTIDVTFEAQAQTATPTYWLTSNPTQAKHILYTASAVDGASWALYLPNCFQVGSPTQSSTGGLNTVTVRYSCATNTTTTNELTLSAWRLGLG